VIIIILIEFPYKKFLPYLAGTIITDSTEVRSIADKIVQYDIPFGHEEEIRKNFVNTTIMIKPKKNYPGIVIAFLHNNEQDVQSQQIGVDLGLFFTDFKFVIERDTTLFIKNSKCKFLFSEGHNVDNGHEVYRLKGIIESRAGKSFMIMFGYRKNWVHFNFDKFLKSIK
jgi:hypothetical protein